MAEESKESFLKKVYGNSASAIKSAGNVKIDELVRVYHDLEKTLKSLKATYAHQGTNLNYINMKKLIAQLSRSKRRIERKIGNTMLLEKQHLKKKLQKVSRTYLKNSQ